MLNPTFLQSLPVRRKDPVSTKHCPQCGGVHLGLIRSQFIKYCTDCGLWFDWPLEIDQEVLK